MLKKLSLRGINIISNKKQISMKRFLVLLLAVPFLFSSCKKEDKCTFTVSAAIAPSSEKTYLRNYLSGNSITAMEDSSGFFYTITQAGTGSTPTVCSYVSAKYTGSFIPGGAIFDATPAGSPGSNFSLGEVIAGWQKGLPLIKNGGKITLYIPPSLAYGSRNYPSDTNIRIPANSYLKFEIELVNVQ